MGFLRLRRFPECLSLEYIWQDLRFYVEHNVLYFVTLSSRGLIKLYDATARQKVPHLVGVVMVGPYVVSFSDYLSRDRQAAIE